MKDLTHKLLTGIEAIMIFLIVLVAMMTAGWIVLSLPKHWVIVPLLMVLWICLLPEIRLLRQWIRTRRFNRAQLAKAPCCGGSCGCETTGIHAGIGGES